VRCGNTKYRKPEYEEREYNTKVKKLSLCSATQEYRNRKKPLFSVHRLYQELKKRRLNFQGGTQASRTRTQFRLGDERNVTAFYTIKSWGLCLPKENIIYPKTIQISLCVLEAT
jgi:hypothetical protein